MGYGYRGLNTTFVGTRSGGWRKPTEEGEYLLTISSDGKSGWREVSGSAGLELGETETTAFRGDHGLDAYNHSMSTDNPHSVTTEQIGAASLNGDQLINFSVADATDDHHAVNKKQLDDIMCDINIDGGTFN